MLSLVISVFQLFSFQLKKKKHFFFNFIFSQYSFLPFFPNSVPSCAPFKFMVSVESMHIYQYNIFSLALHIPYFITLLTYPCVILIYQYLARSQSFSAPIAVILFISSTMMRFSILV